MRTAMPSRPQRRRFERPTLAVFVGSGLSLRENRVGGDC
jgi:hypothetical protein